MQSYHIEFRPELGRLNEAIPADRIADEGEHVVLYSTAWITGQPRQIIARRVARADLARITAYPGRP